MASVDLNGGGGGLVSERLRIVLTGDGSVRWRTEDHVAAPPDELDGSDVEPAVAGAPVDAVVVENRARIAELRQERIGGAPDLGDMLLNGKGVGMVTLAASMVAMGVAS